MSDSKNGKHTLGEGRRLYARFPFAATEDESRLMVSAGASIDAPRDAIDRGLVRYADLYRGTFDPPAPDPAPQNPELAAKLEVAAIDREAARLIEERVKDLWLGATAKLARLSQVAWYSDSTGDYEGPVDRSSTPAKIADAEEEVRTSRQAWDDAKSSLERAASKHTRLMLRLKEWTRIEILQRMPARGTR